jgi:HAD superfamily hydrolase (TIGR01509 family)
MIEAVIFDLDGVLLDSEPLWDRARRAVATEHSGRWVAGATEAMQGMSSREWSSYLHDVLGVRMRPELIVDAVVERLLRYYEEGLPLLPGAVEAVARMARAFPLGLASSSNRPVIDAVLERSGLAPMFRATVSSEEVARGKPAPDVYLEAASRLGEPAPRCAAVEDSANGIRAAAAAGLAVVAIPNRDFPPAADALALAAVLLGSLAELTPDLVRSLRPPP